MAMPLMERLTEPGRETLRAAALRNQPWLHSTGPRTAAGKAQAALNDMKRQKGTMSVREIRAELAEYRDLIDVLRRRRVRSDSTPSAHVVNLRGS